MSEEIKKLAHTIVNYSINVQESEKVLIKYYSDEALDLVKELVKNVCINKGVANYRKIDSELEREILELSSPEIVPLLTNQAKYEVENYDSIIFIRYSENEFESVNVPTMKLGAVNKSKRPYDEIRINNRKWTLLNYPSKLDAHKARMSYDDYKKFAFEVMNVDYKNMREKLEPLRLLMEKTDKVRMVGPNTDITFSIKGLPAIPCCGTANIPDGEVYTAPVRESVNGVITYNTPSPYHGRVYNNISLTFENGKIIKAVCDNEKDNKELEKIFASDEGASYVGEFSFGVNPLILNPMGDILFDEKIKGSIHFTPGTCYDDCNNGNKSIIHWDLVWIQREEYGGGEVYFDDVLIRKNGEFVLDELKEINNL